MAEPRHTGPLRALERVLRQQAAVFQLSSLAPGAFTTRLREILRLDAVTLDVARVSLWRLGREPEAIHCESIYVAAEDRFDGGVVLMARDFPRYFEALRTGQPIHAIDAHRDARTSEFSASYLSPLGIGAMLDIPVYVGGELHAVVCHEHVGPAREWTNDEQLFALSVGQSVSLAIEAERRDRTESALRDSEQRFRAIVEASPVPMAVTSFSDGRVLYGNAALSAMTGVPKDELVGRSAPDFYADPEDRQRVLLELGRAGRIAGREMRFKRADGTAYWAILSAERAELDGGAVVITGLWDVTPKRELEERLRHLALHDDLTRLPNRALFFDLLRAELSRAARHDYRFAVLYLDLDDFKDVNDRFGHDVGDAFLKSVAERIRAGVRGGDVPARVGGDEFVVLLPDVSGLDEARTVAGRVADALAVPHDVGGRQLPGSASVGILLVDQSYDDPSAVLRDADAAMYAAKQAGKSRTQVFDRAAR